MKKKNIYDGILSFKGTWRTYQRRVLEEGDRYLEDGKIHIVAAPGAGKTTLGIELIRRTGQPCLILSPRIVIREQWLDRIRQSFLEESKGRELLSNDLKKPAKITSVTYQTLYAAVKGCSTAEESREGEEPERMDFSEFQLLETVRKAGIKTICLDECHHLKNEWWKALETFMKEMKGVTVISLTATPPYDSTPAQWDRYIQMCGEIDAQITIPELVKEGSLCPHQDYVYFSYPTGEEERQILQFRAAAGEMFEKLLQDSRLSTAAASHKALLDYEGYFDQMLENPAYLSSLLIFCQCLGIPYSPAWLQVLCVENLPDMSEKWMEIFLQGFLYEDRESYICPDGYREGLAKELKTAGLIEQGQVHFLMSRSMERIVANSRGKMESICRIASWEYSSMREELRMLILTDYVRKEAEKALGDPEQEVGNLGVLPVFELLRRQAMDWRLGVLCGSFLIFPDSGKEAFLEEAARQAPELKPEWKPLTDAGGKALGYTKIQIHGNSHVYTQIMTRLFEMGEVQILTGTKALLGEGWDSPCINALILASFVGSYVLGNQMRGRAVRINEKKPDKVSNIWHLVCLLRPEEQQEKRRLGISDPELSQDFYTLKRRMDGILGLRYDGSAIENGIGRLHIISGPYEPSHVQRIDQEMKELSARREIVARQWKEALWLYKKTETMDQRAAEKKSISGSVHFYNALGAQIILVLMEICNTLIRVNLTRGTFFSNTVFFLISAIFIAGTFLFGKRLIWWLTPMSRYKALTRGLLAALKKGGCIDSGCRAAVREERGIRFWAWLEGGTDREKAVFAQALEDMLKPIENQRYLLVYGRNREKPVEYFCVPGIFSGTKEKAENFRKDMEPHIGKYHLIYTRNPEGRRVLLRGRAEAFSNKNERKIYRKKTVKGALE